MLERFAIIGLINLVVYYKSIFYGYVGDDVERSQRQEPVFKNIWHRRWIQFIGLRHMDSMVAHLITLVCHIGCCEMIYLTFGLNNISFLSAILFSVNPVNMQGSVWISGRNYATASILALAMFMFPQLSWMFYAATSYFAVNAWFAPLAFLGTKYWYMVGIIPAIWILNKTNRQTLHVKLWENAGLKTTNTEMRAIKPKKIIPFLKTYVYYLTLCIFPFELAVEHNFLRGFGTNRYDNAKGYKMDEWFFAGLFSFIVICGASVYCIFIGWNPIIWGLFWFTINIAMWSNFVTYQQQIALRYAYLANIGVQFALANLIISYPYLISAFIVGYFVRLWYTMDTYLNDWWAVEYTIREIKTGHYMWLMRGVKKFMDQDFRGAYNDFNESYQHKPYDLKILFNLSAICLILGDIVKAKDFLEKAKANVYDELEQDVKPAFERLENTIKKIEESRARGETMMNINLADILVVK